MEAPAAHSARHKPWSVVAASAACPLLYVAFVWHFSVDALQFEDWDFIGFVDHPTWGTLWSQYGEPRAPVSRLVFLAGYWVDHLNTRQITILSALLLIGAYALILLCFSRYLGRPLTPLPVLVVGVIWFSLADTQNALWAFQVGWYMIVLCLGVVAAGLLLATKRPWLGFAVAFVAAVVGSLSWAQGFALWPVGLVAILWPATRAKKAVTLWLGGFIVTAALYSIGYNVHESSCTIGCRPESALGHPIAALQYLATILGDVVPAPYTQSSTTATFLTTAATHDPAGYEILGAVLAVASGYVVVASFRNRRTSERLPVPLLLIGFALLFAASITWGRVGEGPSLALHGDRYTMAGLILVTGLVIYACKHANPTAISRAVVSVLALFLAVQVIESTVVGWSSATNTRAYLMRSARLVDNLAQIPPGRRNCELNALYISLQQVDRTGALQAAEFAPGQVVYYRSLGLPSPNCVG